MPLPPVIAAALLNAAKGAAVDQFTKKGGGKKLLAFVVIIVLLAIGALVGARGAVINSVLATTEQVKRVQYAASTPAANDAGTTCLTNGYPVSAKPGVIAGPPSPYDALYLRAAASFPGALDATTMKAQAIQESGENPNATSPVGAAGIIQFMPGTWRGHGIDGDGDGRADIRNPADNIMSSAKYTATIAKIVSHLEGDPVALKLAAYNAGPGNVLKYAGIPPFTETRNYIAKIKGNVAKWGGAVTAAVAACEATAPVVASGPWAHPAPGEPLTSRFGQRWGRLHAGVDFGVKIGTPMHAATAGRVVYRNNPGGYGTYVVLEAADGVSIVYGHLSKYVVADGAVVQPGTVIALSGHTGRSTGPHLHFEIRQNGKPVDPIPFMAARGVKL